jgi:hypothetical protein
MIMFRSSTSLALLTFVAVTILPVSSLQTPILNTEVTVLTGKVLTANSCSFSGLQLE